MFTPENSQVLCGPRPPSGTADVVVEGNICAGDCNTCPGEEDGVATSMRVVVPFILWLITYIIDLLITKEGALALLSLILTA